MTINELKQLAENLKAKNIPTSIATAENVNPYTLLGKMNIVIAKLEEITELVEAGTQIYIQATEPLEKSNNDLWINTTNYDLKQYDSDNLTWALKGNIKGETGAMGVSVANVTVNASNHLIVTLTDETEIDAGEINVTSSVVIDTSMNASSENPVQNKVIYTALSGKQDALTTSSVNDGTINKSIGFDSLGNIVKGNAGGGGSGINGYNLTYDMSAQIPAGELFLDYLYVDSNGDVKSDIISSDGTHKSGTLTNVLMIRYNSTGVYGASISGVYFNVWEDNYNQVYTQWLTANCEYTATAGGGSGN